MEFDVTQSCVVGAPASQRNQVRLPVKHRCMGCRVHVYYSAPTLAQGQRQAKDLGKKLYLLCWQCAKPWLENVVRGKATAAVFSKEMLNDELLPRLAKIRQEQTLSN